MPAGDYLLLMLVGYTITFAIETGVLLAALSRRHSVRARLFAGIWLSACTYPVVWLVLPPLFHKRWLYLMAAETFAPAAECLLFWLAFIHGSSRDPWATLRDMFAIVFANLVSFGAAELLYATTW